MKFDVEESLSVLLPMTLPMTFPMDFVIFPDTPPPLTSVGLELNRKFSGLMSQLTTPFKWQCASERSMCFTSRRTVASVSTVDGLALG